MQNKPDITIIIPTYTNFEGFSKLITKLKFSTYPIKVIDNHPTTEKKRLIQPSIINHQPSITYLPQPKNIGFARAINLGVKEAKTDWVLALNDDIVIKDTKIIDKLLRAAIKYKWSAVSPVLKNKKGNIENIGYKVLPIGRVELNFDKSKNDQRNLDGLTAACLLINKKDFETIGGFDENFFAYLEDVDLFLRMKKHGLTFGVDLETEVVHTGHETSNKMGNFKQKQDLKNWIRIIIKNWDKKTLVTKLPSIFIERLRNLSGLIKTYFVKL